MRNIIYHYDYFKNVDILIDELLKSNFPGQLVMRGIYENNFAINLSQIGNRIRQELDTIAFSTHIMALSLPKFKGIKIYLILFVCSIERYASIHAFERKQGGDAFRSVFAGNTTPTAILKYACRYRMTAKLVKNTKQNCWKQMLEILLFIMPFSQRNSNQ